MQLKITRSQKQSGMLSSSVSFILDARVEFTKEEADLVRKYKLGDQVIYNSQRSREHSAKLGEALMDGASAQSAVRGGNLSAVTGALGATARSWVHAAAAKLSLNITIDSLQKGQHIESKSLDEIMGAEQAICEGCENTRTYLNTATNYDGREQMFEF